MDDSQWFRWILAAVLFGSMAISATFRYRARKASGTIRRREEGGLFLALRMLVALPLFFSLLAYIFRPQWMSWSTLALAPVWRWAGAALGLVTVPLVYWVFSNLGKNVSETTLTKDRHELVTTGPYRWVRHPLYTVGTLLLISVSLLTASWLVGSLTALATILISLVVMPREEQALIDKFGDQYRDYQKRTGRWLPKIFGRTAQDS